MKRAQRADLHRFTRRQYARLIDHGVLDEDDPIELLDGLLLVKEPQSSAHRTVVLLVGKALERAFGNGWFVQMQSAIILDDRSEPEPDVSVVRGAPRDYVDSHPRSPALIVEVAQSGLRIARGRKAVAYARAALADYWIVNLVRSRARGLPRAGAAGPSAAPLCLRLGRHARRDSHHRATRCALRARPRRGSAPVASFRPRRRRRQTPSTYVRAQGFRYSGARAPAERMMATSNGASA